MDKGYSYIKNKNINVIWGMLWPCLLWYFIQLIISFVFGIAIVIINPKMADSKLELFLNDNILFINLICQIVSLITFLPIYLKQKKYFIPVKEKIKDNIYLVINVSLIFLSIGIISGFIIEQLKITGLEEINNAFNSKGIFLALVSTVILAPIIEELLFRGLIFNRINSKWNGWLAIIISALLFAVLHGNLPQILNAFILGIGLGYFYNKYHNLWYCIIAHALNNFVSIMCQQINFHVNGNYTVDCIISKYIYITIIIITIVYCLIYYKKLAKN